MTIPLGSAACAASAARGTLGTPSLFTGVQQSAIWQWGFVERLVNGLRYIEVGPEENAVEFLAVVEAWAEVETV